MKCYRLYAERKHISTAQKKDEIPKFIKQAKDKGLTVTKIEYRAMTSDKVKDITKEFDKLLHEKVKPQKREYHKICPMCGTEFTTTRSRKIYCNVECQRASLKSTYDYTPKAYEKRYCINCGKELDGKHSKYCSTECINEWKRKVRADKSKKTLMGLADVQREAKKRGVTVGQYLQQLEVERLRNQGFWDAKGEEK